MTIVSVIIPTYDNKELLDEAIDSVLSQTLSDLELIIIDDGSTDGTAELVKTIDDSRIRYFYKNNNGVSSARNMGLDKAVGQYIAFLDSDDLYKPKYLETMVSALKNNADYGVAYTAATNRYPDGQSKDYREQYCRSGWITKELFDRFFVLSQTCVIRTPLAKAFFFDEQAGLSEDVDYFLQLSCQTQFLYVPQAKVIRRVQHNSLSQANGTAINHDNKIRVLERFYYELGGKEWIPKRVAHTRFSRQYRKMGRIYCKYGARKAAISMLATAIRFDPFRFRNYQDFLWAFIHYSGADSMPDWEIVPPLGKPKRTRMLL